jgi:hypothetical protein
MTIVSRRRRQRRRALGLALGICALAIPASAIGKPIDSGYSSVNAISGNSGESSQPTGGSGYQSVNSIAPPASEPGGSQGVNSGYSSLNAISGAPTSTPTLVSGSTDTGDGFDWGSALVGAGAALALAALGTAAMLTVRRRTAVSPSASTG